MKTVRWGIIGCGAVTEVKSGPGFQKADHSSLMAVMRRTGELAKDYAKRHNVPKWYDNAKALINDPAVDAVYIATPPNTHKTYTLLAAKAGKPVYVEKPMALNHEECEIMIRACEKAHVPLFIAYYRRALPRMLKIKELIDSKAIGEVRFVNVTFSKPPMKLDPHSKILPWRVQPEVAGGGLFVDLASHMLDFLDYVLGPIRKVHGFASNQAGLYPAEDIVSGSFVFESGAQGSGTWCFSSFEYRDLTEITGTDGMISYATFGTEPVVVRTNHGQKEYAIENPMHIQQPLIQRIVNTLNGTDTCPSTGDSAARTTWVMEQMLHGN